MIPKLILRLSCHWNTYDATADEPFELPFDDKNSYIVVKLIAAKTCGSVIDIAHEALGRERRITAHYRRKALHTELFAKPVLRLGNPISVENQYIAGHEVFRGQFTNLFRHIPISGQDEFKRERAPVFARNRRAGCDHS